MANVPKRPEIALKEFEDALGLKALTVIDFDPESFGQAANNGQMIEELSSRAKAAPLFREIAMTIAHRKEVKVEKKSALAPLLEKLKLKR
jgi:pilus assembly protein CpaE